MTRRSRRLQRKAELQTYQAKIVQGPQRLLDPPIVSQVVLESNLGEKYLGRGLVGYGPYLEVLQNIDANDVVRQYGYKIFRKMSTDAEVDASLDTLIQASTSQPVTFLNSIREGQSGYQQAQEITDFVTEVFSNIAIDEWRKDQLRQAVTFGNAVSEIDWGENGTGQLIITRLRRQEPEDYGFIVDRWGEVYGVAPLNAAQTVYAMGNLIPIQDYTSKLLTGAVPRYKLTVWIWDQRGTDPRGTSILIPAYVPWWSKQRAIEEWACWLGRYAQPSIWATPGPNAVPVCVTAPNGSQTITQPTEALLNALLQFRSASVLALPYGSEVNILDASGSVEPFLKSIDTFNTEITRSILGEHLASGSSQNSSKPAAELHALILRQLISSLRQFMIRLITRDLVKPLVEANYGFGAYIPEVSLGDSDGFPPTVTEIAVLFQAGYFSQDQLPALDKLLGLPIRVTNDRVGAGNLPQQDQPNATTTSNKPQN